MILPSALLFLAICGSITIKYATYFIMFPIWFVHNCQVAFTAIFIYIYGGNSIRIHKMSYSSYHALSITISFFFLKSENPNSTFSSFFFFYKCKFINKKDHSSAPQSIAYCVKIVFREMNFFINLCANQSNLTKTGLTKITIPAQFAWIPWEKRSLFSNSFSSMEIVVLWFKFHCLFLRVQWIIC